MRKERSRAVRGPFLKVLLRHSPGVDRRSRRGAGRGGVGCLEATGCPGLSAGACSWIAGDDARRQNAACGWPTTL